jgi:Superfamily II DNA and RNA helicases
MICTDVASRGLDFDDVKLIIQLDAPPTITDYVNRMGRTARIGHYGLSLLFLTESEKDYVKKLKENSTPIKRLSVI